MATIAKLPTEVVRKAAVETGIIDASIVIEEAVPAKNPQMV